MKRIAFIIIFLWWGVLHAQPPRSYTSSEILLQLKKLNTVGSVLYIAAHPDDENTRLIAYLANEKCLRTGYLSLTRGDGGQNLIGPEQGVELGVIRTQELLAARRIDGGEQFFTRAYDFGYSKTPEETFKKWNKDSVLSDVVWVIRNFRPDIIITRFATDGSGGHGHHTASAILAEEAFDAAGDPKRFPEQLQHVEVWQPRRLFYNATNRFRDPNADMSAFIKLDVGGYNPLLGKSYGEIAAESRSMHKSQGFGSAKQRGEYFEYFKPVKGDTAALKDIFAGMDFTWKRVKGGDVYHEQLSEIIKEYRIEDPGHIVNKLFELWRFSDVAKANKKYWLSINYRLVELIKIASGVWVELNASTPNHCFNDSIELILSISNRSGSNLLINQYSLPYGIVYDRCIGCTGINFFNIDTVYSNQTITRKIKINANEQYPIKEGIPYWLINPIKSNFYDHDQSFWMHNNINPSNLGGRISFSFLTKNNPLFLEDLFLPITYKWVEPEKGELYRPALVYPEFSFHVERNILVFPNKVPQKIKITVVSNTDSIEDDFSLHSNKEWSIEPKDIEFDIPQKGGKKDVEFIVTPPSETSTSVLKVKVVKYNNTLHVFDSVYGKGIKEVKYDHIPIQTLFPEAEIKLIRLDVKKKLKRIGYIPGAGDEVAPCLTQLGYEVITLTDDVLAKENLSQFEAILTGVRAYNTNEKLPAFKQKLMDYVANGGNLIVQYNTNSWAGPLSSDIGPYKFKITRERITDEEAKVNFELPNHPVLNTPNKITDKDFEGWIQERSIYHAGDWDSNYVAPLSMADPGEKNNKGALIIAKHGKGHFVYSGLVFFRQLPAGVPGAYRLLVNMIELGK